MTKFKSEVKFPCGYEAKTEINTLFGEISFEGHPSECPLHGKDCGESLVDKGRKALKSLRSRNG